MTRQSGLSLETDPIPGAKTVLVLAPLGRDAEVACAMLHRAGLACREGREFEGLDAEALERLATLVVTEELLSVPVLASLAGTLSAQPHWSSLPVIVLANPERRRMASGGGRDIDVFAELPGVVLLARPMDVVSFVSVVRSASMTRQRQYELRDQLRARERAAAKAQILAEEMKHRVKNVLTVATSIASQTFRTAETLEGALEAYSARLGTMSRAQDLLTERGADSANVRELISQALRPYRPGEDWGPFNVEGEDVRVPVRMATTLSMALHELATNATKYGALSVAGGRVAIRWRQEQEPSGSRLLHLRWQESGGPLVTAPAKRGFGSRLVERALAHDLGGTARIDFEPEGIVCTICAMLSRDGEIGAA